MRTNLSPDEIRKIADYVMPITPLEPAELVFVFGTPHHCEPLADAAAELWRSGMARRIIATGGLTGRLIEPEAEVMRRLLAARGVPNENILTEEKSTNTGENVEFALPIINRAFGLENVGSVIAVTKLFAARRCLMTLERYWPSVKKMVRPVNYFRTTRERWNEDPELRVRVLREHEKIPRYLELGFVRELR
ncbi:YdcF family protein [Archangium violaceum]|uniref:YdcF family protein n=1 Tax=Archangium violaceum TaxID=83451 RepID=UPI002B2A859F|nr:YdcF family protein [Archangium violaceum]